MIVMNKEEIIDVLKNMQQEMNNASGGLFERLKNIEIENGNLQQENKQLKKELEKADSITQSCIFQGKEESEISFRNCLNKMTDYKTRIDKAIELLNIRSHTNDIQLNMLNNLNTMDKVLEILEGE